MGNSTHRREAPLARAQVIRRRGVAAVELALVLPLLVLVVFGAIDFGRFGHAHIAVTNAARSGAEFGSVNPVTSGTQANWEAQIRQRVLDELQSIIDADSFEATDLQVSATRVAEADSLWRVRVVATYPFRTMISWPGLPKQVGLSRAVEMRGIR